MTDSDKTLSGSQQGLSSSSADAQLSGDGKSVEGVAEVNQSILDEALERVQGSSMINLGTLKREIRLGRSQATGAACDSGSSCDDMVTQNNNCPSRGCFR
jgi:uncharacterized membrane protein